MNQSKRSLFHLFYSFIKGSILQCLGNKICHFVSHTLFICFRPSSFGCQKALVPCLLIFSVEPIYRFVVPIIQVCSTPMPRMSLCNSFKNLLPNHMRFYLLCAISRIKLIFDWGPILPAVELIDSCDFASQIFHDDYKCFVWAIVIRTAEVSLHLIIKINFFVLLKEPSLSRNMEDSIFIICNFHYEGFRKVIIWLIVGNLTTKNYTSTLWDWFFFSLNTNDISLWV